MNVYDELGKVLSVDEAVLERLDYEMKERTGKEGVMEALIVERDKRIEKTLTRLNSNERSAEHVRSVLRKVIVKHEEQVMEFLDQQIAGDNEFEKAAKLARELAKVDKGFFLKKEFAKEILRERKPENLLSYLKLSSVEELFKKHDITESFSALRFVESDEWMHKTFEVAYSKFTPDNFEIRPIEVRALGPEWHEIAKKFVAKKHHNVSHLKEFGVIFINPVAEHIPGKFLRDFALLLHYFHEVEFYSKLFKKYAKDGNFAERLKALLRGDVPEIYKVEPGEWLIVQRYLIKENPDDPRLFIPRVNPEAMHWARGERDLTDFGNTYVKIGLEVWEDLDWVGCICEGDHGQVVSFDLEDNAMSLVSFMEGKEERFNYHQREAMWTRLFSEYVGGEDSMEELLLEHFDKGIITF